MNEADFDATCESTLHQTFGTEEIRNSTGEECLKETVQTRLFKRAVLRCSKHNFTRGRYRHILDYTIKIQELSLKFSHISTTMRNDRAHQQKTHLTTIIKDGNWHAKRQPLSTSSYPTLVRAIIVNYLE